VNTAETYTNGQLANYSTITQTANAISAYVNNNAYKIQSGVAITADGVTVSGGKYVKVESSGTFDVTASTFGIRSSSTETYAIWAGNAAASSAPFRVKPDGTVYLTKLIALNEQNQESEVNLRTTGLWKLNYATIKTLTVEDGFCTSITLSNKINGEQIINFKNAASVWSAAYSGSSCTRTGAAINVSIPSITYGTFSSYGYQITVATEWRDVGHLNAYAKINGITVATETVRANQPS